MGTLSRGCEASISYKDITKNIYAMPLLIFTKCLKIIRYGNMNKCMCVYISIINYSYVFESFM